MFLKIIRYIMLRENVELNSIPGMVFCPRCKFRTVSDPESTVVMCDNDACRFPFCKTCRQTWHGPIPCPALAKVIIDCGIIYIRTFPKHIIRLSDTMYTLFGIVFVIHKAM